MAGDEGRRIYEELGLKPLINASGNQTVIGGSRLSPAVRKAMEDANRYFVDMEPLLKRTGEIIADMLGAEAALVTPGCAAALALSSAACMSGSDTEKVERLPDTTGMANEILIHRCQRYKYDRCLTIFGARLVEFGDGESTAPGQLEAAISDRTAAVHYLAPGDTPGVLPFADTVRIAEKHGVPVIVDAASEVYPLDHLRVYTRMGAGLVGYGAKYFGACNSTGLLCGRKELVDAAFVHSFIGFETGQHRSLGRPLKLDRQEVIATLVALREWLDMDRAARLAENERKSLLIQRELEGIPHITVELVSDEWSLGNGLRITLDEEALGKTAVQVAEALLAGDPAVWIRRGGNPLHVTASHLVDGDEVALAHRLREELDSGE